MRARTAKKVMRAIRDGRVRKWYSRSLSGPYSRQQISDALKRCTPRQFVEAFGVTETWRFWGVDYKVMPACVEAKQGDGGQVLFLTPMDYRPNYYVIRINSSIRGKKTEYLHKFIELEIYELIEDEFCEPCYCEEDGLEECICPGFPNTSFENGSSWGFML